MRNKRKPKCWYATRISRVIVDYVSDYREKMRSGELEWTDCITMNWRDFGMLDFNMLKKPDIQYIVSNICSDGYEMIDAIRLTKTGLKVSIDT